MIKRLIKYINTENNRVCVCNCEKWSLNWIQVDFLSELIEFAAAGREFNVKMETAGDESAVNTNNLAESTPSAAEAAGNNNEANEGMEGAADGDNPTSLGELGVLTDGDAPMSLNLAVGPPSPLTGCYLLIIIGEPHANEHKDIIVQRILKGKKVVH